MKKPILYIVFIIAGLISCKQDIIFLDHKYTTDTGLNIYRYEINGEIVYTTDSLPVSEQKQAEQLEKNRELLNKIKNQ